jgi:hypothetical protein
MARARYYDVTQFPDPGTGLIHKVNTVQITVYEQGTTTLLAESIYQADTGGATYPNPRTITNGELEFYLDSVGGKRVSIKFDATGSGYGVVTKNMEPVWPDPASLGTTIKSPNGTYVASYDNNGILTAPGLLHKRGSWDLEVDGGLTPGQNVAFAVTNATKFQQLLTRVKDAGGGDIEVNNLFVTNPIHMNHGAGGALPINLVGRVGRGVIHFNGASGPFLTIGSTASDRMDRVGIYDVSFQHQSIVTGGATIQLGAHLYGFELVNVEIINRGAGEAALIGVTAAVAQDLIFDRVRIHTRNDYQPLVDAGLVPIAVELNNSNTLGGVYFRQTELSCVQKGANPSPRGILLRLNNTGTVDTIVVGDGCHFIGAEDGVLKNGGVGSVTNVLFGNCYITDCNQNVRLEPPTGANTVNWNFTGGWYAALKYNFLISKGNGGSPQGKIFTGIYCTDATLGGIVIGAGVNDVNIANSRILTQVASGSGVVIGDNTTPSNGLTFTGGVVGVLGTASNSYNIGSAVDNVTVAHVRQQGKAGLFNGGASASRIHVPGSFLA